jgi:hypothetical protein
MAVPVAALVGVAAIVGLQSIAYKSLYGDPQRTASGE